MDGWMDAFRGQHSAAPSSSGEQCPDPSTIQSLSTQQHRLVPWKTLQCCEFSAALSRNQSKLPLGSSMLQHLANTSSRRPRHTTLPMDSFLPSFTHLFFSVLLGHCSCCPHGQNGGDQKAAGSMAHLEATRGRVAAGLQSELWFEGLGFSQLLWLHRLICILQGLANPPKHTNPHSSRLVSPFAELHLLKWAATKS